MKKLGIALLIFGTVNAVAAVVVGLLAVYEVWPIERVDPMNIGFFHGALALLSLFAGGPIWAEYS